MLPRLCRSCFSERDLDVLEAADGGAGQPALLVPPPLACGCSPPSRVWPAWTPQGLAHAFPTHAWDLGREDGARATLPELLSRAAAAAAAAGAEEEPLYIFDADFCEAAPTLAAAYAGCAPAAFPLEDGHLAALVDASSPASARALRRPWRWLLVSAPHAGFAPHVDPHGSAAWNVLLHGRKRWALLPPHAPLAAVLPARAAAAAAAGGGGGGGGDAWQPPAAEASARGWAAHVLPGLRARAGELGLLEFDQLPGELLYIPAAWWHAALTVGPAVAVGLTHNFMRARGFAAALTRLEEAAAASDCAGDAAAAAAARSLAAAWLARVEQAGLPLLAEESSCATSSESPRG